MFRIFMGRNENYRKVDNLARKLIDIVPGSAEKSLEVFHLVREKFEEYLVGGD